MKYLAQANTLVAIVGLQASDRINREIFNRHVTAKKFIEVARMIKKYNIIILLFLLFTLPAIAQEKSSINTPNKIYSDRITDESGAPLSGIRVRVKGTSLITFTDINGQFSIHPFLQKMQQFSQAGYNPCNE